MTIDSFQLDAKYWATIEAKKKRHERIREDLEWAQSDLYPHPLKVMKAKGKPVREYVRSIIKFIKSSLP